MRLREKMALHGFESNDDYDYQVDCLLNGPFEGMRCLNIEGDSQRRKTAFANALAYALEIPHIIYHDFSEVKPPPPAVILPPSKDESGKEEPPISALDNRFADACGYSEGEKTVIILDQLHVADFREHIRLYKFITTGEWQLRGASHSANKRRLLIFMISEEPLYHSLQNHSFRVWVGAASHQLVHYEPHELGLDEQALPLLEAMDEVFSLLETGPTKSEYVRILTDVIERVRDREALRTSIYGWMEGVDRSLLMDKNVEGALDQVIERVFNYLGCHEVELVPVPATNN
jgi:hypothetical protein